LFVNYKLHSVITKVVMFLANREGVTIQSLERAFDILELFEKQKEMGISEISTGIGLSKSTVYGLVNTLVKYNYLEQDLENKKYRLGMRLFEMGSLVEGRMDIRREAKPYCEMLSQKYGLTVHLATHYEGEVVYIDKYDQPDFMIVYSQVGKRAPMTCTGVGKAMLAFLGDKYIEKYVLSRPFEVKTLKSISNSQMLYERLEEIRKAGFARDDEEIAVGLRCRAVPIFGSKNRVVGAMSISGMVSELDDEKCKSISDDLIKCSMEISNRLGYRKN
jgi:IclR family KDG regulon transcriptional repressor